MAADFNAPIMSQQPAQIGDSSCGATVDTKPDNTGTESTSCVQEGGQSKKRKRENYVKTVS
jgi:hypothetical protein